MIDKVYIPKKVAVITAVTIAAAMLLTSCGNDGKIETSDDVVTAPNQFNGYWTQSRDVTENDYEVAIQSLEDWYANDCEALSEYLFFEAGDNRENEFRKEF